MNIRALLGVIIALSSGVILLTIFGNNSVFLNNKINAEYMEKCNYQLKNNKKEFIELIENVQRVPLYEQSDLIDLECLNNDPEIRTILMWTNFKGLPLVDYGYGERKPFERMGCPVTNCELTNDRNKFNKSNLILFHLRNRIDYIPNRNSIDQRYVHVIFESPINCFKCTDYKDSFNLSATYTSDSDYSSIYWTDSGLIIDENSDTNSEYFDKDIHSQKTEFIGALISNCASSSLREDYIKDFKKYVPVTVYGKCGTPCPSHVGDCKEYIMKKYKFFLAFENSFCRDYVTEKFFNALKYDIIPIVLGGANYTKYVPKSAFINVLDYESPLQLANYLIRLNNSKTEYNKYFSWKRNLRFSKNPVIGAGFLCEMCIQLNLESKIGYLKRKKINNVDKRFGLKQNCKEGNRTTITIYKYADPVKLVHNKYMSPEAK